MTEQNQKIITGVRLLGIEKRYLPNKHYLYILSVKWSEGSEFIIYRRYSAFFQLHSKLTELFPIETGVVSKKDQKIPPLPKQKWFGNERFKVAESRQTTIDDYCRKVAMAEPKISEHEEVLSFFEAMQDDLTPPTPDPERPNKTYLTFESRRKQEKKEKSGDDLEISAPILLETYRAIATFTPGGKTELGLEEGAHVDVVEKNMSGWWLVQVDDKQGWCPASYLEPLDQPEERDEGRPNWEGEEFRTTQQYKAQMDDEISFDEGVIVHVIHKLLDGWWIIRYNDKVGYAPCAYLEEYSNPHLPLHKFRARINSDASTGSFIKKLPPRRSTIHKKSSAHKKVPKHRDLQLYRRKSTEASRRKQAGSKENSKLESARENYKRLSNVIEGEEPQQAGTYMDMTGNGEPNTDSQGYLLPNDQVGRATPPYMSVGDVEEIAAEKSSSSGISSTEGRKATESHHAYVNEEVLAQGSTGSAHTYVNEESLSQGHGGGKSDRSADDVWAPAFVSPNTTKAAETRNTKSVNTSVWAPAFVNEEKSKKEFPKNPNYINSDSVASMTGKPKVKNTEFLNLGYVPDAPISADAWNPKGPNSNNNNASLDADADDYENVQLTLPNNRLSHETSRPKPVASRPMPSPRARRAPVPTPRSTAPSLLVPGGDDSSGSESPKSGRSTPKSGRSTPKSGRSSPYGGRVSPSIPARPTSAEIAAKCSSQTKRKILQPEEYRDSCVINDTQERKSSNKDRQIQECPVSPAPSETSPVTTPSSSAVINKITAMIGKSSPSMSPENQRKNKYVNTDDEEKRQINGSFVIAQEDKAEKPDDITSSKNAIRVITYDGPSTIV